MAPKRLITAATLLGFGLNLAGCGGFVADHWPHWAGGLPADVPPRPGAPGYAEFIAHGQAAPDAKPDSAAAAAAVQNGAQQTPVTPVSTAPAAPAAAAATPARTAAPAADLPQDSSVVNGGLY